MVVDEATEVQKEELAECLKMRRVRLSAVVITNKAIERVQFNKSNERFLL